MAGRVAGLQLPVRLDAQHDGHTVADPRLARGMDLFDQLEETLPFDLWKRFPHGKADQDAPAGQTAIRVIGHFDPELRARNTAMNEGARSMICLSSARATASASRSARLSDVGKQHGHPVVDRVAETKGEKVEPASV